jgi:small subunit ribosomal protein S8
VYSLWQTWAGTSVLWIKSVPQVFQGSSAKDGFQKILLGVLMLMDPLADGLSKMKNYEIARKREVVIEPASKLIADILRVAQHEGFIGEFEFIDDGRAGKFRIALFGKINNCGVIRPRHAVKRDGYEKWEKRYLPAAGFGLLVVSTPKGIMTHTQARDQAMGGRLLAYMY